MNYIVGNQQIENAIIKYIESVFNIENINWMHELVIDDEMNEYESENAILFYLGDFSDDETIFRWYGSGYWDEGHGAEKWKKYSPLIQLELRYEKEFDSLFSNYWHKPFKRWFNENFDFEVNYLTNEI
jgi:hypothetical protein